MASREKWRKASSITSIDISLGRRVDAAWRACMPLKKLLSTISSLVCRHTEYLEYPLEIEEKLNLQHSRAPLDKHLEVLFADEKIGGERYTDLYRRCLATTGTPVTPFNIFHRFQSRRDLVRYFLETLALRGARAECGVYRGATALLLAHAWRSQQPDFKGNDLYLIDSFV